MKRLSRILVCLLLVVAIFALVSCDDKPQPKQLTDLTLPALKDNQMAVIIKNGDNDYVSYTVNLNKVDGEKKTVEDVLAYLKNEAELVLEWSDGSFGKFITAIGGIKPASNSQWVTVLTSNGTYQDNDSAYSLTYTVGDVKLVSAMVGVSDMDAQAGDVVYFELAGF